MHRLQCIGKQLNPLEQFFIVQSVQFMKEINLNDKEQNILSWLLGEKTILWQDSIPGNIPSEVMIFNLIDQNMYLKKIKTDHLMVLVSK